MLRNPAPAMLAAWSVRPLWISGAFDTSTSCWAISRGLRRSFFESCMATLLERSPCSGFFGRSTRISGTGSEGAILRTPSSRIFLNVSFGSPMEGRNYRGALVELDRIDVDVPAHCALLLLKKMFGQSAEEALKRRPRGGLHHELRALEAGAPRDDMRHRVEHGELRGNLDAGRGFAQEAHGGVELWRLGAQRRFEDERRKSAAAAIGELRRGEAGEVMARERGEQRMRRIASLHEHFAELLAASGTTGDLHQNGEQPLGRPIVGRQQRGVGVHHHDQRELREVVNVREELWARQ